MIFGVDICHGTEVHLDPIKVEFVGEGNRSKFAVKGGQKFTTEIKKTFSAMRARIEAR